MAHRPPLRLSFREAQALGRKLQIAASHAELEALLAEAAQRSGFSGFLLLCCQGDRWQHLSNLTAAERAGLLAPEVAGRLGALCAAQSDAFLLDGAQLRLPETIAAAWAIPFHGPADESAAGWCLLRIATNGLPAALARTAMQYLAFHAFEALRQSRLRRPVEPRLTKRQLQCMVLAARGKSDWIAGAILGLSPATVHKYLEQAKARYGVSSRTELVVRALHDGEIGFSDLMDR
jgi:DNA-binding CsgD family transcriptional regulator